MAIVLSSVFVFFSARKFTQPYKVCPSTFEMHMCIRARAYLTGGFDSLDFLLPLTGLNLLYLTFDVLERAVCRLIFCLRACCSIA